MLKLLLERIDDCDRTIREAKEKRANLLMLVSAAQSKAAHVLRRFNAGDYIVNSSGRHFWCNDGNLLHAVYPDDMAGLTELVQMGVITNKP